MSATSTFKRYELKYFITPQQKAQLLMLFQGHMVPDIHGASCIYNLYYDTPDFLLIRRSLEKPVYKEKLRVRSYGRAKADSPVFLELKKKYKSVVYKRRISLSQTDATEYFTQNSPLHGSQIGREIDYFNSIYPQLAPRMFISYQREAFFDAEDDSFRITFDDHILWRDQELTLCSQSGGYSILPPDTVLMELKVSGGIPLWLTQFLTQEHITKTSFSKYGTAYRQLMDGERTDYHVA